MTEHLYQDAGLWFSKNGYDVFIVSLYTWEEGARQLMECDLTIHGKDLDLVVRHFKKTHKKIFLAGHSFGAPSILSTVEQKFDGAIFWDGSYDISLIKTKNGFTPKFTFLKRENAYLMNNWGASPVISKAMADQVDAFDWNGRAKTLKSPLFAIVAGNGILVEGGKAYATESGNPKNFKVIKNATHYFDDSPAVRSGLFTTTKRWLDAQK